jgi:hypothetical protein
MQNSDDNEWATRFNKFSKFNVYQPVLLDCGWPQPEQQLKQYFLVSSNRRWTRAGNGKNIDCGAVQSMCQIDDVDEMTEYELMKVDATRIAKMIDLS